jgi:hypothetical protein
VGEAEPQGHWLSGLSSVLSLALYRKIVQHHHVTNGRLHSPTFAFPLPAVGPAGAAEPSVPLSSARARALYPRRISTVMLLRLHDFTFAAAQRLPNSITRLVFPQFVSYSANYPKRYVTSCVSDIYMLTMLQCHHFHCLSQGTLLLHMVLHTQGQDLQYGYQT